MRLLCPDTGEPYDLDNPEDQQRLFLSEKTAKLEGSVITEPLFLGALGRAEVFSPDRLVPHVWFGQHRRTYHVYALSPSGSEPTRAEAWVLDRLDRRFPVCRVWPDGEGGFCCRPVAPRAQPDEDLEAHLQKVTGKRQGARLPDVAAGFVLPERARHALTLARRRGDVQALLVERLFANLWLSRYYGFTPRAGGYVPLVYDVDLFVPFGRDVLAIEVKQKNPMHGRSLRVGLNRSEAKLLAALQEVGCRPLLFYLLKQAQEEPARLLDDARLIRTSCWLAAEVDARALVAQGKTVASGRHTSLGGTTTAPSYVLPIAGLFRFLAPTEGAPDIGALDGERLRRFLEGTLEPVTDDDVRQVWRRTNEAA